MKKIYKTSIMALSLTLLVACGKKSIDTAGMAEHLNTSISFTERLTELSGTAAEAYFMLNPNDYEEIEAYISTKACCDELVVVKTKTTATIENKLTEHINKLREDYTDYRPMELDKLDRAVINTYKDTVVMIIAPDIDEAQTAYKEYLKTQRKALPI